jgi:hypothetical protein
MSTDETMIRLLIKEPITRCQGQLFATNYEKLFVTVDFTHLTFMRKLPSEEYSTLTYVNQQDSWLTGKLSDAIITEHRSIKKQDCMSATQRKAINYEAMAAEQRVVTDGETASLGNGVFVQAAGDAWYRYKCKEILVFATTEQKCYASLTVQLQPTD